MEGQCSHDGDHSYACKEAEEGRRQSGERGQDAGGYDEDMWSGRVYVWEGLLLYMLVRWPWLYAVERGME